MAPKSLSKSCDKDGSCEPEENAWGYLPDVEVRVCVCLTLLASTQKIDRITRETRRRSETVSGCERERSEVVTNARHMYILR